VVMPLVSQRVKRITRFGLGAAVGMIAVVGWLSVRILRPTSTSPATPTPRFLPSRFEEVRPAVRCGLFLSYEELPASDAPREQLARKLQRVLGNCVVRPCEKGVCVAQTLRVAREHPDPCGRHATAEPGSHSIGVDVVFYHLDEANIRAMVDSKRVWAADQFDEHLPIPAPRPALVFRDLGLEDRRVLDFVPTENGVAHIVMGDVFTRTRILYVRANLHEGKWLRDGVILWDYPQAIVPRVRIVLDGTGAAHVFWVKVQDGREELLHCTPTGDVFQVDQVGAAENLAYDVLATGAGDVLVFCDAYNFEGSSAVLGFRIGGQIRSKMRCCRKGEWSQWRTVPLEALRNITGRRTIANEAGSEVIARRNSARFLGLVGWEIVDMGGSHIAIVGSELRGTRLSYSVERTR